MPLNPRVLLTGARGRVGRAVQSALAGSWNLTGYSRTGGDGLHALAGLVEGTAPLEADALLHCAWSCVPASAEENPGFIGTYDLPLLEKLVARLKREPRPPLLVFLSTGAVYGSAQNGPSREKDPPAPTGVYARGKLAGEELLGASGLPVCILRTGNLYGLPSTPNDRQGVLARLVRCAIHGQPFKRWGSDPVKDYLHSDDFFAALQIIVTRRLTGIWNLGSGAGTPLSKIIALVEADLGMKVDVQYTPAPSWDVQDNRLDISLFRDATGWMPTVALEEGVAREVAVITGELDGGAP